MRITITQKTILTPSSQLPSLLDDITPSSEFCSLTMWPRSCGKEPVPPLVVGVDKSDEHDGSDDEIQECLVIVIIPWWLHDISFLVIPVPKTKRNSFPEWNNKNFCNQDFNVRWKML